MTDRGEFQEQLAALVAEALGNGLQFEDILPEKMLKELKTARECMKEREECEDDLRATNEALVKKLKEKQREIDELPAEFQALKVDMQQAQRQIALYKKTSEDAQERVDRYRRQLDEIIGKQHADTSGTAKVEDLQTQIEDQHLVINKLMNDNRKAEAMFQQRHESDVKALERKDKQLAKKEKELAEKDRMLAKSHQHWIDHIEGNTMAVGAVSVAFNDTDDEETLIDEVGDDHLEVQQQNIELLQQNLALSEDNTALKDQNVALNAQLHKIVELYEMALSPQHTSSEGPTIQRLTNVVPEVKPLNRFYESFREVLGTFAQLFRTSLPDKVMPLSDLELQLDAAQHALEDYCAAKEVMRATTKEEVHDDADQVALRKELDSIAQSAYDSLASLNTLYAGFWYFVNQLSEDPKMLSSLNGALCDADRVHYVDLNSVD